MIGGRNTDAGFRARVTSPFSGVKDGDIYPVRFSVNDVIRGDLARTAVAGGLATWIDVEEVKEGMNVGAGPFPTGAAKSSSSPDQAPAKPKKTSRRLRAKRD